MSYSLGIDLGTSGVKIVLVTIEGEIVKEVSKIYPIYYPQSGWAEQHPEDWWYSVKEGIKEIRSLNNTLLFDKNASRISSRSGTHAIVKPSGSSLGTSFKL